jgi:hypothetical protein
MIMRSPPRPVTVPPTEVAKRKPRAVSSISLSESFCPIQSFAEGQFLGAALAPLAAREQINFLADLAVRRLAGLINDRAGVIAVEEADLEPDKRAVPRAGRSTGGGPLSRGHIYKILLDPIYVGRITHKSKGNAGVEADELRLSVMTSLPQRRDPGTAGHLHQRLSRSFDKMAASMKAIPRAPSSTVGSAEAYC